MPATWLAALTYVPPAPTTGTNYATIALADLSDLIDADPLTHGKESCKADRTDALSLLLGSFPAGTANVLEG